MVLPGVPPTESDDAASERSLVARLKAGEDAAFEELVRAHGPRMLAVARRFLPQEADAQDALQDALVNVVRAVHTFDCNSRLTTWLHRVVVNAALMRIRSRSRRSERCMEAGAVEVASQPRGRAAWAWSASDLLSKAELREIVREEIARLPEPHRVVLMLRDVEGLELREIASLVDAGLTTVKMRLHHGRRALRAALEPRLAASKAS